MTVINPLQRPKLTAVLLVVSLAANLFLAGWMLGGYSIRRHALPRGSVDRVFNEQLRKSLSPDGAKIVQAALASIRGRFTAHASEVKAARERLAMALKADPFDAAHYLDVANEIRAERNSDRSLADQDLSKALALLSTDDRQQLVDMRRRPGSAFGDFFERFFEK